MSYSPTPDLCLDVDVALLIGEVRKRPVLWNKLSEDYNSKVLKGLLWEEVHQVLFDDWKDLSSTEKRIRSEEVKKKWRNLRDSFSRELSFQLKAKEGKMKRKKRYCHFELLTFLRDQINKAKPDLASSSSSEDEKPRKLAKDSIDSNGETSAKKLSKVKINAPRFLNEVKKRPLLWNRNLYTAINFDRELQLANWMEVCQAVYRNWDDLDQSIQLTRCAEAKKKWKNYRDAYSRELKARRKEAKGIKRTKRTKHPYKYYDEMTFLEGQFSKWSDFDTSFQPEMENGSNHSDSIESTYGQTETPVEIPVVNNFDQGEYKTYDQDVSFTEMLVPLLKKLNDDQKHYAQVEILNVLNKARKFDPLAVIQRNYVKDENHFTDIVD